MTDRVAVAKSTAEHLAQAGQQAAAITCLVGFDGFVDAICDVVETRPSGSEYTPVATLDRLGSKISASAGLSSNLEVVVKQRKLGGNGPIFANALASFGLDVTYVGNLGYPDIDPVFADFGRQADLRSIANPGYTDALEFTDGKLMLGKHDSLGEVTFENIQQRLGVETFERLLDRSKLVAMVNWTMLSGMSRIWAKLIGDVFDQLPTWKKDGRRPHIFIDLADPEKRTRDDLSYAVKLLSRMQPFADVTLGLNAREGEQVAAVLGVAEKATPEEHAVAIRKALDLHCVVVHPRSGASAATAEGSASFEGPFVQHPKISTGAGDHFNAGFMLGRTLGLDLAQSLCCGVGTSGYYVRSGDSPTLSKLAGFIGDLPAPEGA